MFPVLQEAYVFYTVLYGILLTFQSNWSAKISFLL